jgi:serine/threonine protein kinase
MKQIEIKYSRSSQFNIFFDSVNRISIEDSPFAEGGFGRLYHCRGFNFGQPAIPQVVKVFKESAEGRDEHSWNTINKMQARIIDKVKECKHNGEDFLSKYPALIALPQIIFSGLLDGKSVRGYVSNDLSSLNYKSFDKIMEESQNELVEREMQDKYVMCYHLAKAFKLLESISFIHADLSADNIFISNDQAFCAVIDFDSGAVVENPDDNPSTWGKPQDWLAPEIRFQVGNSGNIININLFSDIWSVCVAIHYILVNTSPYTFLNDLSLNTLTRYTGKYKWPQIDSKDSDYNADNKEWYEFQLDSLDFIPDEVVEQFETTFTHGVFDKLMRTSYYRWELIFKKILPKESKIRTPTPPRQEQGQTQSFQATQSSRLLQIGDDLQKLKDYLNDLIRDIIFEGEKLERHIPFIKSRVQKVNLDEKEVIKEFKDFIELYYNVIGDKKVTKFERTSLYIQGEIAMIEKSTIDSLIASYKER